MKKHYNKFILSIGLLVFSMNVVAGNLRILSNNSQYFFTMSQDTASQKYIQELNSPDAVVRSNAAHQLCIMKHPLAVDACIKTINDLEDINHLDYTPSVSYLIEIGKPALLPLTDLMYSKDEITRLRACKAIEIITFNMFSKAGSKNKKKELKQWKEWWLTIGLRYNANDDERKNAVEKLKKWLADYK